MGSRGGLTAGATGTTVLRMRRSLRLLCPAKINLHLRVGPRRPDGFHALLSWMCSVGLFDTLTLDAPGSAGAASVAPAQPLPVSQSGPGNASGKSRSAAGTAGGAAGREATTASATGADPAVPIDLTCDAADLPCDERNLVVRVMAAWGREVVAGARTGSRDDRFTDGATATSSTSADVVRQDVRSSDAAAPAAAAPADASTIAAPRHAQVATIRAALQKRIPMGAGLGGGSSDAARALAGVDHLWGTGRGADVLSAFAARFGSDLSFFFHGPSSICTGRGEVVRPVARPRPGWALLVLPQIMMPTPDVYRTFDAMGLGRTEDITEEPDWSTWSNLGAVELLPRLVNDLEAPAFALRPELDALRRSIERDLGRTVRMSGSGSSLFTLFDERHEADAAAERIGDRQGVRIEVVELAPRIGDDLASAE